MCSVGREGGVFMLMVCWRGWREWRANVGGMLLLLLLLLLKCMSTFETKMKKCSR